MEQATNQVRTLSSPPPPHERLIPAWHPLTTAAANLAFSSSLFLFSCICWPLYCLLLVIIFFIRPKFDQCLALFVTQSLTAIVKTWLMWPWLLKSCRMRGRLCCWYRNKTKAILHYLEPLKTFINWLEWKISFVQRNKNRFIYSAICRSTFSLTVERSHMILKHVDWLKALNNVQKLNALGPLCTWQIV